MSDPNFDLEDLITPLTRQEIQAKIYTALATMGVSTTQWATGAVIRTMIVCVAIILAALSQLIAAIARGGYLSLSTGNWLTLVARYVYGVRREAATFAAGVVTLTNVGGGVYPVDEGDLTVRNADGKEYTNVSSFVLNAVSSIDVAVVAIEEGSASSTAAGTVTQMTTPLLGVTVTNAAEFVAFDEEKDASLTARCTEKLGALSPMGPWDAYTYAARNAKTSTGASAGVNRAVIDKDGFGTVNVYVAGASGSIPGTVGDLTTPLGAVDDAIQRQAAALAVTANALSASGVVVPVTYEAWAYNTSGLSPAQFLDAVTAALRAYLGTQPVGGNVINSDPGRIFSEKISAAIVDAVPEIYHAVVTVPAGHVTLSVFEVATLGLVTQTALHLRPPPEGFGGSV